MLDLLWEQPKSMRTALRYARASSQHGISLEAAVQLLDQLQSFYSSMPMHLLADEMPLLPITCFSCSCKSTVALSLSVMLLLR